MGCVASLVTLSLYGYIGQKSNKAKKPWTGTFETVSQNKPLLAFFFLQLTSGVLSQDRVVSNTGMSIIMEYIAIPSLLFLYAQKRCPLLPYPTVIAEVSELQLTSWVWGSKNISG